MPAHSQIVLRGLNLRDVINGATLVGPGARRPAIGAGAYPLKLAEGLAFSIASRDRRAG